MNRLIFLIILILSICIIFSNCKQKENLNFQKDAVSLKIYKDSLFTISDILKHKEMQLNKLENKLKANQNVTNHLLSIIKTYNDTLKKILFNDILDEPIDDSIKVRLYFYNYRKAEELNSSCDSKAVIPIEKFIPYTSNFIENTIKLRLYYILSPSEIERGFEGEFPFSFQVLNMSLSDSIFTLEIVDPEYFSSGGSCRSGILQYQLEKTILQFPKIKHVRFLGDVFQP